MLLYPEVPIGGSLVACARCARVPDAPPLSAEDVGAAAARLAAGGALALVGADAFAREDWAALVHAARAAGVTRLRVDGGPALSGAGVAERVLAAGVRHVRIGVLDANASGDCGRDALAAGRAFAEAARRTGVKAVVTALLPLCRHNLHDAPATVAEIAAAGVAEVTLSIADPSLPAGPAAPWLAAAADSGTVNRLWVRIEGVPADAVPGYGLHFTAPFALAGES